MNYVAARKVSFAVSAALVLISILLLIFKGLNLGIDFRGGTLLERGLPLGTTAAQVQEALASLDGFDLGSSYVQPVDEAVEGQTVVLIRTRAAAGTSAVEAVDRALEEAFGEVTVRRTEVVGPVIGRELVRKAVYAVVLASLGILVYMSIRFELRFGIAAILALLQDVFIVLGVLALSGRELNTPFIAAMLTVVGYSINNTIVVFDRIRENLQLRRARSLDELVNASVGQTLMRQINTSLTTFFAAGALYFLGGSTIRDFTLPLVAGILAGTYSSIFLAGPLWFVLTQRVPGRAAKTA